MSNPTTNMAMGKAVNTDNSQTYLVTTLAAALDIVDGHDHSVDSKGLAVKRLGSGATGADLTLSGALAAIATYKTVTSGTTASQASAVLGAVVGVRTAEARAAGKGPQIEFANLAAAAYGGNDYGIIGVIEAADSTGSGNLDANLNFYVANPATNTLLNLLKLNAAGATFSKPVVVPSIGQNITNQHTLPAVASDTVALLAATQTFTNKTVASPTITGRITATGVGASAKTLLNYVPLNQVAQVVTAAGDTEADLTLTNVPASAVAVSFICSAGTGGTLTLRNTAGTVDIAAPPIGGVGYTIPTNGSGQMRYKIAGSGGLTWSFSVKATGYWEAT